MGELGILSKNQLLSVLKIKHQIVNDIVTNIELNEHDNWYDWYTDTSDKLSFMSDEFLVSLYIREDIHGSNLVYNLIKNTMKDQILSVLVQTELLNSLGDSLLDWKEWNKKWSIENTSCYKNIIELIYSHMSSLYWGKESENSGFDKLTAAYFLVEQGKYLVELLSDGGVLLHKQDSSDVFGKKQDILGNSLDGYTNLVYYEKEKAKDSLEMKIESELASYILRNSLRVR